MKHESNCNCSNQCTIESVLLVWLTRACHFHNDQWCRPCDCVQEVVVTLHKRMWSVEKGLLSIKCEITPLPETQQLQSTSNTTSNITSFCGSKLMENESCDTFSPCFWHSVKEWPMIGAPATQVGLVWLTWQFGRVESLSNQWREKAMSHCFWCGVTDDIRFHTSKNVLQWNTGFTFCQKCGCLSWAMNHDSQNVNSCS